MKSILVPIDFSKDSINALEHAIHLANKLNSNLRIIHVRKDKNYDQPFIIDGKEKAYSKTVEEFCMELLGKYRTKYTADGFFNFVIKTGKIYKAVSEQALLDKSYLIIMGTHGVSGFEEFWLGSNSYRVVCKAPCPVLTVRHGFKKLNISKIVLPIDAHRETRIKVPITAELAGVLGAEVHVVSVRSTTRADIVKRLKNYASQTSDYLNGLGIHTVTAELIGSSIADITYTYAVHSGAELITIVSNQRGTPVNMGISSTAQQMVNHSPIPVLSIHPSYSK